MTQIPVAGNYAGLGLPSVLRLLPELSAKLHAAYLFGSDFPNGPGFDYSGNGRHVTVQDEALGAKAAILGGGSIGTKITLPFTGTELSAAGKATPESVATAALLAVVKTPLDAACFVIGCSFGLETSYSLVVETTNNGRAFITEQNGTPFVHQAISGNAAPDANRAARNEMLIASFTGAAVVIYRIYTGTDGNPVVVKNTLASSKLVLGAYPIQLGIAPNNSNAQTGVFSVTSAVPFHNALTDAEALIAFGSMKARLAMFGMPL